MQKIVILALFAAIVNGATTLDQASLASLASEIALNTADLSSIAAQFTNSDYLSALSAEGNFFSTYDTSSLIQYYSSLYASIYGTSWLAQYSSELSLVQAGSFTDPQFLSSYYSALGIAEQSFTGDSTGVLTATNSPSAGQSIGAMSSATATHSTDSSAAASGSQTADSSSATKTSGSTSSASSAKETATTASSSGKASTSSASSSTSASSSKAGSANIVAPMVGVIGALAAALI